MKSALHIHVTGIVQGVGFRPFVVKQAKHFLINGWVCNAVDGVRIHAEGDENLLDEFCISLSNEAPIASKVEQIEMKDVPLENFKKFEIKNSDSSVANKSTLLSPDLGICKDCKKELFDKNDKRYRYPFINCTNCGPRFTIINKLPYDRDSTSMEKFKMCDSCQKEYDDFTNRRFHAQPNACFECGPYISWKTSNSSEKKWGKSLTESNWIFNECVKYIQEGKIVAVKSLGGYHLVCDALNDDAVNKLRNYKVRDNKALAVLAQNIESIKKVCFINEIEEKVILSEKKPIVLLRKNNEDIIAPSVSNGLPEHGFMLPYTPVQELLIHDFIKAGGQYLVMTSANISNSPIVIDDNEIEDMLGKFCDAVLGNNRKIVSRYDDSVIRVLDFDGTSAIQVLRRARSFAPMPIKIPNFINSKNEFFATGPEQKNTFCFVRPCDFEKDSISYSEAFLSQHIGDLENAEINDNWIELKDHYKELFKFNPKNIVCDMHPNYFSTQWAKINSNEVLDIQHHYAHILSVMGENSLEGPVLGFSFDGTGFGIDNNIWGGEALICNFQDFERFANFSYFPLPGASAAIKNPSSLLFGLLYTYDLLDHPGARKSLESFSQRKKNNLVNIIENGINCPYSSSLGRVFDAVSVLTESCINPTYEGECAVSLEADLWNYVNNIGYSKDCYEILLTKNTATKNSTAKDTSVILFDLELMLKSILNDIESGVDKGYISLKFHNAIVQCVLKIAQIVYRMYGINQVALSGGVFMNRYLIEECVKTLINNGFSVAINNELPPNDGNISLGQAFYAINNTNV